MILLSVYLLMALATEVGANDPIIDLDEYIDHGEATVGILFIKRGTVVLWKLVLNIKLWWPLQYHFRCSQKSEWNCLAHIQVALFHWNLSSNLQNQRLGRCVFYKAVTDAFYIKFVRQNSNKWNKRMFSESLFSGQNILRPLSITISRTNFLWPLCQTKPCSKKEPVLPGLIAELSQTKTQKVFSFEMLLRSTKMSFAN